MKVELDLRADALDADFGRPGPVRRPALGSVYLGGGTPSLLPAADVAALLERIERRYGLEADAEVTIEANPGPDERGDLAGFRAAGVTRVSFGAQSLDAAELRRLGRRHRPVDVVEAVEAARHAGIAHRSVDLLYDLPGQSMASWQATVERALDLAIDHLSAYALTLDDPDAAGLTGATGDHLPVRPGARRWRRDAATEQDDDRAADQYLWLDERLQQAGFTLVRGLQLGAAGRRESAQPGVLAPTGHRRRRSGCAWLRRWTAPDVERGPARWLSGRPHARRHRPGRCSSATAPARRRRDARRWRDPA